MACSKFEYVKHFEQHTTLLRNTYVVVRIDGHSFHRFTKEHQFAKPNDIRGLQLMNHAAKHVMEEFDDIKFSFGQSDEFRYNHVNISFVLARDSSRYQRREAKLITNICSLFTSVFVMDWNKFFDSPLKYAPSFDSRAVCYPTFENLRDYINWRQTDTHINNLYNTAFWALVHDGKTEVEAENILKDTNAGGKNELLFSAYQINYNNIDAIFRKGSTIYRAKVPTTETSKSGTEVVRNRSQLITDHCDLIGEAFWKANPDLL
jgi:tRNA(His) guanylyltransferase